MADDPEWIWCACGCGQRLRPRDRHGRPRRFIYPHQTRVQQRRRQTPRIFMTLRRATEITGGIGRTTKMPGYSYGLDPLHCRTGSELAKIDGTICQACYALRPNYTRWPGVPAAWARRHAGLDHPEWVEAMVELIWARCQDEPYFRWHDSGDLQSPEHLDRIAQVADLTPWCRHWIPTREQEIVSAWLAAGNRPPPNLVIRVSSDVVDDRPLVYPELEHLPTSTVHGRRGQPVQVSDSRKDSVECRSWTRGGECGRCRACWTPEVRNTSFPVH